MSYLSPYRPMIPSHRARLFKDDNEVDGKVENSTPAPTKKNPKVAKICMDAPAKRHGNSFDSIWGICLPKFS